MTKTELIAGIAEGADVSKAKAGDMVNTFISLVVAQGKSGKDVTLPGFGTFKVSERSARTGRNPQTGVALEIAASRALTFKQGKTTKEALNG
jgi:DNA-binding protein HU-beta